MSNHKEISQQRLSPLPLRKFGNLTPPLLSRRLHKDKDHQSILTLFSKTNISDRCQTPGPNIIKADSKGRPLSPLSLKKKPEDSKDSQKKSKLKKSSKNFQYLASLFIEKLDAAPVKTKKVKENGRKHIKSPNKKQTRICCVDKSPIHRQVYEPKGTMTENFISDSSLQNLLTEVSDILITPRTYNSCKKY